MESLDTDTEEGWHYENGIGDWKNVTSQGGEEAGESKPIHLSFELLTPRNVMSYMPIVLSLQFVMFCQSSLGHRCG